MNVTAAAEASLPKHSWAENKQSKSQASLRGVATGEAKTEGGKRCSDRLSRQACRRNHAACTTTTIGRRAGRQGLHVRGLKKTEPTSANGHAPNDVDDMRVGREHRQQGHSQAEQRETEAAENSCGMAVG